MNKAAILHIPKSQYAFAYSKTELRFRFRTAKNDMETVELLYAVKYDWQTKREIIPMQKRFSDSLFDYYTVSINVSDSRIGYIFILTSGGKQYFYSEDGLTDAYDHKKSYYSFFQYPYINESDLHNEISWCKDAVVYQIFVDRFNKGNNTKNCGYINKEWGEKPTQTSFFGGDLNGVCEKLDYLAELGVNCIYLTPIFYSHSNHKYDTIDYSQVDEMFGGNAALKKLVDSAHAKGIRILLDAVFNHCSDKFSQFRDVVKNGRKSPYHDWFIIRGDRPVKSPLNYECFAYCDNMPKFNTNNREVQDFLLSVGMKWLKEYNIDGWRLDVSDEVSHVFWKRFTHALKRANPEAVIIGENWHDARPWLEGDEYDSIMNYSFTKACLDFFAHEKIDARQFADKLNSILMRNTDQVNNMMLNVLDSHDTERFLTNANENKSKLKCALATMFFFTGIPCVYYGTEAGLLGGYDPDSRRTFNWNESEWAQDVYMTVKELIKLKKNRISGDIAIDEHQGLLILKRKDIILVVNNTKTEKKYDLGSHDIFLAPESYIVLNKEN